MDRRCALRASVAAAWLAQAGLARSAGFPEKPIRIVQGYAPGGNADTIARVIATELARSLGQPVNVDAVTGAGGMIAAATVARAPADGYTMLIALGGHAIAPALNDNLRYRAVDDFEMVSMVSTFPMLVVVRQDSPYRRFTDLLAAARERPGSVAWGSAGVGTGHHLGGELLARMAAMTWLHVPYRGDAASLTALLAGDIAVALAPPTAAAAHVKAGSLRALAVTGGQRWAGMPDLPTVAEQGVPGYDVRSWAGLMVPAGTPRAVLERLSAEVNKLLKMPAVRQRLEAMGGEVAGSSPEQMRSFVSAEVARWSKVALEANLPRQP